MPAKASQHVSFGGTRIGKMLLHAWTKSPRDYWRRVAGGDAAANGAVWATGKHRQWNRLPYYLRAFQVAAGQHGQRLDFAGRKVLEFGAGPVLGFAPFALVEGATSITVVDPGYLELRGNPRFENEYLFPLHCTHSRLTERRELDFASFLAAIGKIEVHPCGVEQFRMSPAQYDLVLSKSCIEYLPDIDRAVAICHEASTAGSLHFHYIDFSMHRASARIGSPFGTAYQHSRGSNPEYLANPGGDLNLLRPSDVVGAFQRRFGEVYFFPLDDYRGRISLEPLHADWARYSADDLTIANGVLLAIK